MIYLNKENIKRFFYPILIFQLTIGSVAYANDQKVLVRTKKTDIIDYQKNLQYQPQLTTPMQFYSDLLKNPELNLQEQELLNQALQYKTEVSLELFLEKTKNNLMTSGLRETRKEIIRQLILITNGKRHSQREVDILDFKNQLSSIASTVSVSSKERFRFLQLISKIAGGEDAIIFINGQELNPEFTISEFDQVQWAVVSSQWQFSLMTGNWSQFKSWVQANLLKKNENNDWVQGSCNSSYIASDFLNKENTQILWESNCSDSKLARNEIELPRALPMLHGQQKNWLIIASAIIVTSIALSANGKTIQISK